MSVEFLEQLKVNVVRFPVNGKILQINESLELGISVPNTSKPTNTEQMPVIYEFNQYDIYPYPHPLFGVL
mgnify:CR=1 FL=1|tara:strand:- start:763 stop:972 length:210 start_codon:yes stop_codon:yes gene_type:complete